MPAHAYSGRAVAETEPAFCSRVPQGARNQLAEQSRLLGDTQQRVRAGIDSGMPWGRCLLSSNAAACLPAIPRLPQCSAVRMWMSVAAHPLLRLYAHLKAGRTEHARPGAACSMWQGRWPVSLTWQDAPLHGGCGLHPSPPSPPLAWVQVELLAGAQQRMQNLVGAEIKKRKMLAARCLELEAAGAADPLQIPSHAAPTPHPRRSHAAPTPHQGSALGSPSAPPPLQHSFSPPPPPPPPPPTPH